MQFSKIGIKMLSRYNKNQITKNNIIHEHPQTTQGSLFPKRPRFFFRDP